MRELRLGFLFRPSKVVSVNTCFGKYIHAWTVVNGVMAVHNREITEQIVQLCGDVFILRMRIL